eukprot:4504829-Karenia_brevis.AAC.1
MGLTVVRDSPSRGSAEADQLPPSTPHLNVESPSVGELGKMNPDGQAMPCSTLRWGEGGLDVTEALGRHIYVSTVFSDIKVIKIFMVARGPSMQCL